jgi:hypothetical protein
MNKNLQKLNLALFTMLTGIGYINAQCPTPSSVTATPSSICAGASSSINATATGAAINWYTVGVGGTAIGSSASGANFGVTPGVTTIYYAESFVPPPVSNNTFTYTGTIQNYTVPVGVTQLTITAVGASGGSVNVNCSAIGGRGASVSGVFTVTPGQVLALLVGQKGFSNNADAGGGGGSFVVATPSTALLVAGGGGGASNNIGSCGTNLVGIDATLTASATASGNGLVAGGVNGNGGGASGGSGGGGGGFLTNGTGGSGTPASGGKSFLNGGAGGTGNNLDGGGFGGGGAGWFTGGNGGGGGGYSGGGTSSAQPFTGGGGGASFNAGTNQVNIAAVGLGDGTITITAPTVGGCTSAQRIPVTVTVTPNPTITVNSGAICSGKSFTITPSGANTYTITGGTATVSPLVNSSYTVTGTGIGGCAATNTVVSSVTVNANPTITVASGTACSGANYTIVPSGGISYTYSGGSSLVTPTVNTSYTVTGANAANCTNTAVATITVISTPITVNSGSICAGGSFTIVPSGATTYTYSSGSAVVTPTATSAYTVTGTGTNACVGNAISNVTVTPLPTVLVASSPTLICAGQAATLTASGATSYVWNTTSTLTAIVVSPTVTTNYTVTGNSNGCSKTATVSQNVSPCTGINSFVSTTSEINIFPNPSTGVLNIDLKSVSSENINIQIVNSIGAVVLSSSAKSNETKTVSIQNLANGIYFVKVLEGNSVISIQKVVKD